MDTRLTKEEQAMIKEAKGNKVSGPIYSEDGLRFLKVLGNPEYLEVKDGVKAICDEACLGLDNLHDVVLPASVIDLGTRAFASCIKLFEITMPGIEFIGTECFAHCENLKEIALPETLGKIWKGGADLRDRAHAVGGIGRVAEIEKVLPRQALHERAQDTDAAEAGIKHRDRKLRPLHGMPLLSGMQYRMHLLYHIRRTFQVRR